jgi:hypothetical protein
MWLIDNQKENKPPLFCFIPSLCLLPPKSGLRPPFLGRAFGTLKSDWDQSYMQTIKNHPWTLDYGWVFGDFFPFLLIFITFKPTFFFNRSIYFELNCADGSAIVRCIPQAVSSLSLVEYAHWCSFLLKTAIHPFKSMTEPEDHFEVTFWHTY